MVKPIVRVTTAESELEFTILSTTYGKELFDQVVKTIGLREVWYFGLEYFDRDGCASWLRLNKRVLSQDVQKADFLEFRLRAKFYPEDVDTEIIQTITLRMFYLQVKEKILTDSIFCPADVSVLLASYAMQVKYGDYIADVHRTGFLASDRLVSSRVRTQHKQLSPAELERRVMLWWADHRGMRQDVAMLEYLKLAEDLEMYGVDYFEIANKAGSKLCLGVNAHGINVYKRDDQLNPEVGFSWADIRDISFEEKKFRVRLIDKKAESLTFYTDRTRINKMIMTLCMGNHELYLRRRRPDTVDMKQMRDQAAKERAIHDAEQQRLREEMQAREAAERKQHNYEKELDRLLNAMAKKDKELEVAQEKIRSLEDESMSWKSCQSVSIGHQQPPFDPPASVASLATEEQGSVHAELAILPGLDGDEPMHPMEMRRVSFIEQNIDVRDKLHELSRDLDAIRDDDALTRHDIVHMENKLAGRDKYKMLLEVLKGNTQSKINKFEKM